MKNAYKKVKLHSYKLEYYLNKLYHEYKNIYVIFK